MRWGTLLLAACTGTSDLPESSEDSQAPSEPLSAEALSQGTTRLTAIGPRLVGTPEEEAARDEVIAMFEEAGLAEVGPHTFVWDAWQPGPSTLRVGDGEWSAEPLSPSPATEGLEAPLVVAGTGDITGAIAIYSSDDGARAEQFLAANAADAAAMIRVTEDLDTDGKVLVEVGHTFETVRLPAVAVDRDAGAALRDLAGEMARLDLDATVLSDHTSANVSGRVDGTGSSVVYVTAHYDSWHPSESAIDNALGVAVQAGLAARLAAGPTPKRSVVFLATSAEEQGLQGAIAYTLDHADDIEAHGRDVLNLDIPWASEGNFWCNSTDSGLRTLAIERAEELGLEAFDGDSPSASSDHVPFQGRGLEATWLTRQPDRHYHTTEDNQQHLDFDQVELAAEVNWTVLAEIAGVPD